MDRKLIAAAALAAFALLVRSAVAVVVRGGLAGLGPRGDIAAHAPTGLVGQAHLHTALARPDALGAFRPRVTRAHRSGGAGTPDEIRLVSARRDGAREGDEHQKKPAHASLHTYWHPPITELNRHRNDRDPQGSSPALPPYRPEPRIGIVPPDEIDPSGGFGWYFRVPVIPIARSVG